MRVLMVSWEYPPLVVGGLGRHVEALARSLAAAGHEVRVVTRGQDAVGHEERRDDVVVIRAACDPLAIDFTTESLLAWAQAAEHALLRAALPLVRDWRPDVVHAHDWLVAQSAVTLSEATSAPLVTTVHATEAGRHQGWLPRPLNLAIHSVERWLVRRSAAVITCSTSMRDEVADLVQLPVERIVVVPNGIDGSRWTVPAQLRAASRAQLAPPGAPLLVFAGRLVHEKGVQTVLDALPVIRETHPGTRLVVAGTGGHEAQLRALARRRRIARAVSWLGFLPEDRLPTVLAAADAVVVPSLYEPFGIVALEAVVAGAPLVAARTGGLLDLVSQGIAAASFAPGNAPELAVAVSKLLIDGDDAQRAVARAAKVVRREYAWDAIASTTAEIYRVAGGR